MGAVAWTQGEVEWLLDWSRQSAGGRSVSDWVDCAHGLNTSGAGPGGRSWSACQAKLQRMEALLRYEQPEPTREATMPDPAPEPAAEVPVESPVTVEAILASVPRLEPAQDRRIVVGPSKHDNGAVMILDLSDKHSGAHVDGGRVAGLGGYDREVEKRRELAYVESVAAITSAQRATNGPLTTAHVHMLGDMVDGEGIYPTQAHDLEASALQQVTEYATRWASLLIPSLLDMGYTTVKLFCVPGNHGRPGGRKSGFHPSTNFDLFAYHIMREHLRDYHGVTWHIARGATMYYRLYDRLHFLMHGDQVRGHAGIPFYGVERARQRATDLAMHPVWGVHMGHHHRPISMTTPTGGFVSMNGCWPGGSELSINGMLVGGVPTQQAYIVDRKRLVAAMTIELDEAHQLPSGEGVLTPCYGAIGE